MNNRLSLLGGGKFSNLFWLTLYYGFCQWLPDSFSMGGIGRTSDKLRVLCCRHLFAKTGSNIHIGRKAYFGKGLNVVIGNNSNIGPHCHVPSDIEIGNDVMMASNNYFFESVTHKHDRIDIPMNRQGVISVEGHIIIKDDVWIGRGCVVLPCKTIGSHSIIGAGSVVTKNVPEYVIVAGNPAKVIKLRNTQ